MAFSPDGKLLASAGDSSVRLWDVDGGNLLHVIQPGASIAADVEVKK